MRTSSEATARTSAAPRSIDRTPDLWPNVTDAQPTLSFGPSQKYRGHVEEALKFL